MKKIKFNKAKILYVLILFTTSVFGQNSKETYKEYHNNGELKIIGERWGKSKVGDWKIFDEKGVITGIYTFHPVVQERYARVKKFENGKLKSHKIYDLRRDQEFELDVLNQIYTLYEADKNFDDEFKGKVLAKIEVALNNEKLEALENAIFESYTQTITSFRYLIEGAILADYKFIVKYYDGDTYLGYKNHITGEVSVYYKEFGKGQVKEEGNCLNGEIITYHKNGQIKEVGNYKKGSPTGVWKEYNDNGKLISKEKW